MDTTTSADAPARRPDTSVHGLPDGSESVPHDPARGG